MTIHQGPEAGQGYSTLRNEAAQAPTTGTRANHNPPTSHDSTTAGRPDFNQAIRFLTLLDETAESWTFQTFDDNKARKATHLAKVLHGTLEQHWLELCRLSAAGAGIFITANETNGKGRKVADMIRVRAVFQECDRPGTPELPLEPHIVVESSPGKYHRYLLVDGGTRFDLFEQVMTRMVHDFGSDPNAKDRARVLRLPGFPHQKDPANPWRVPIIHESSEQPYSWDEVTAKIPPLAIEKTAADILPGHGIDDPVKVRSALAALDPGMEYQPWLQVGMALHHTTAGGTEGFSLWDEWSARGNSYRPGETAQKWRSFGSHYGNSVTLASVFKMATAEGWRWKDVPKGGNGEDTEPFDQAGKGAPAAEGKPVIDAIPGELHIVVRKAEQALIAADVHIFQRGGVMVRPATLPVEVQIDGATLPAGSLVIEPVTKAWLTGKLNEIAIWRKHNERKKEMVQTDCPMKYAEFYLAKKGEWNIRVLTGIIEAPTLRRDGSLLTQSGYDVQSGLYLNYTGPPVTVPANPTRADALKALDVLKEPLDEFPFAGAVDLSVALSGLLTAVIRRSLRTAPFHAIDAPTPGTGKGLLVDVSALIATRRPATAINQGADPAEDEKRVGAMLIKGVSVISLDNVERNFEGEFLCSLATQETVDHRVLGTSTTVTLPSNTVTVFITGNNLVFKGDITRRVLLCRIDPQCERPDARQFKRDLHQFITDNRHRLLSAALTVLRAYICEGSPSHGKAPYGSFTQWDGRVRGALLWLGQPDPLDSRERLVSNDPVITGLRALLASWFEAFGRRHVTAHEVIAAATPRTGDGSYPNPKGEELRRVLLEVAGNQDGSSINSRVFGRYLSKHRDKVASGYRLEQTGDRQRALLWRVKPTVGGEFKSELSEFREFVQPRAGFFAEEMKENEGEKQYAKKTVLAGRNSHNSPNSPTNSLESPDLGGPPCGNCQHFTPDSDGTGTCAMHGKIVHATSDPARLSCGDFFADVQI